MTVQRLTDDLDLNGHHLRDWRYLSDIPRGGASTGQVLAWDGTAWAPSTGTASSIPTGGTPGQVLTVLSDGTTGWADAAVLDASAGEPNGFVNVDDSTYAFDPITRVFTLSPVSVSYVVWVQGVSFTKTTTLSITLGSLQGKYYVYFNTAGELASTMVVTEEELAAVSDLFAQYAVVAMVYHAASTTTSVCDYRHGVRMDDDTVRFHEACIKPQFARKVTVTLDLGDGSLDSHAQIGLSEGVWHNSDMQFSSTYLTAPASLCVFRRDNAYAETWVRDTATSFPVKTGGSGRLAWNSYPGSNWGQQEASNGYHILVHLFATLDRDRPYAAVQGVGEYPTAEMALYYVESELDTIMNDYTGMPFGGAPIASICYQTNSAYANSVKGRVVEMPVAGGFINYTSPLTNAEPTLVADTVAEKTDDTGVYVDGLLIKDGVIGWAGVDKTGSSLADLATKTHTALSDIGTNTHAQIDTHIANTSNPHSVTSTQVLPSQTSNSGKVLKTNGTSASWASLDAAIEICFDGGGATLTVDKKGDYTVPFDMTITGWDLLADQSGSVEIGVWKDTYANYPPTVADVLLSPSITTATKNQASSLSHALTKGDILRFNVNSVTTIQRVTLALKGTRSA